MSNAPVAKVYHVPSDSNPSKSWEVLERMDGFLSCLCPVWVFNKRKTEPRSCKHTERVKRGEVSPTTIYQETVVERTRIAEKVVERQASERLNRGTRLHRNGREQQVRGAEFESLVDQTRDEVNKRKLARIAERLKKETSTEGMDVFPTKRKVNWQ